MSLPKPYYDEGGITIYHADCRDILPHLPKVDLVLTDPPYPNNAGHFDEYVEDAIAFLNTLWLITDEAMIFWNEIDKPLTNLPLVAVHIWHRPNVNGRPYEPVFHFEKSGVKRRSEIKAHTFLHSGVGPGSTEYLGHPTQKPVDIMGWLISLAESNSVICDPYMGSGSTLAAAKDLGRKAIGIEIEEKYCEIAVRRLAQEVLQLK